MKQSQKATLPVLNEMTSFRAFIERGFDGDKFIAHASRVTRSCCRMLWYPDIAVWF